MLLAACGDDSDDAAGGGSASTSEESAGGGGDGGGEVQVVNILPPQLGYSAEYIADIDGYFKKEGLSVKVNTARGSAPAIQAVLSGTALLIVRCGWLESVIAIANRGAPIQAVSFTGRRSTLEMVSDKRQPMNTPQDLMGKRIGIPSEGGTSETTLDLHDRHERPVDPERGAAAGHRLHPGHVRAHQEGPPRRLHHRRDRRCSSSARRARDRVVHPTTAKFVQDGQNYITSPDGLHEQQGRDRGLPRGREGRDASR